MNDLTFVSGADRPNLREQFADVVTRSYGHPIADIEYPGEHADLRVALRGGTVIAGGLGLLVEQYFGGNPCPARA